MNVKKLNITGIPAILWGEDSQKLIIAIHGSHSSKIDDCIWILAEEAVRCGYQVLSFDLPQHGERVYETEPCTVQKSVKDLKAVIKYAKQQAEQIYLFGCSMGAYFSLMAYKNEKIQHAWFLSPVTDMEHLIYHIMELYTITEEQLREEKVVVTPVETLYWDEYCYVREHPVTKWKHPTSILYGELDDICEYEVVAEFAEKYQCGLEVQKGGEHWFHTPEELDYFRKWIHNGLKSMP